MPKPERITWADRDVPGQIPKCLQNFELILKWTVTPGTAEADRNEFKSCGRILQQALFLRLLYPDRSHYKHKLQENRRGRNDNFQSKILLTLCAQVLVFARDTYIT